MRVVITGMGIVSSIGNTIETFWGNLMQGNNGLKKITRFDTKEYKSKLAGEITDFDPTLFMNQKSLFKYDRIQLFAIGAAHMAWENAGLDQSSYHSDELGVVLGSTYGYIDSVSSFYIESLKEGPAYVSPIAFANTVMNAPSGKIAIEFKITGLSSTIATGCTSGLDAIRYSCDVIKSGKCKAILVGAGSVLSEALFMGFYHSNCLSKNDENTKEFCAPFDENSNGFVLGEGAGILVLEELESAQKRGAYILAEIREFGDNFVTGNSGDINHIIESQSFVMKTAIEKSGLQPEQVSCISSNANSSKVRDSMEAAAILKTFGSHTEQVPLVTIKSAIGECLDASSIMQSIAGVCSMQINIVPCEYRLNNSASVRPIQNSINSNREINSVLINSFSYYGKNTAMVVEKYHES